MSNVIHLSHAVIYRSCRPWIDSYVPTVVRVTLQNQLDSTLPFSFRVSLFLHNGMHGNETVQSFLLKYLRATLLHA